MEKKDFNKLRGYYQVVRLPITEIQFKIIPEDMRVEDEGGLGVGNTQNIEEITRLEYFLLFNKSDLERLEKDLGYSVHVYSLKEKKMMRRAKKKQHKAYLHIHFSTNTVHLTLKKENNEKKLLTPFIYYDYFILRANKMLKVENNVNIENEGEKNEKKIPINRELILKIKGFEYYHNIYNFISFNTTHYEPPILTEERKKAKAEMFAMIEKPFIEKEHQRIHEFFNNWYNKPLDINYLVYNPNESKKNYPSPYYFFSHDTTPLDLMRKD